MAMPAQAQLTFEWHLVETFPVAGPIAGPAQTNAALLPNAFTPGGSVGPLTEGQSVTLQLMIRDATGTTFPWAFGDGVYPPPASNINGTGFFSVGMLVRGTPGVFAPAGNSNATRRLTPAIDTELPAFAQGSNFQPYGSVGGFAGFNPGAAEINLQTTSGLQDGNPFENGDFPRVRPGTTAALMPIFNMTFTAGSAGMGSLQLLDVDGTPQNAVYTGPNPAPGGDMLDATLFSTYVPLQISVVPVPEPTSMALVGVALVGFGYRKLRRKKEVVA
jgi:hypothetical protein